jgi:NTP pyrophosphatase (non-canonical NTP hydrolase)
MELNEYQNFTDTTAIYGEHIEMAMHTADEDEWQAWIQLAYAVGKLNGEAGEIANELFKVVRDTDDMKISAELNDKLLDEAGDCLYYIARIGRELGMTLNEIAERNMDKLNARKQAGTITGSGHGR